MKQYINQIFSLIFGVAVFVFFAFFYQYHLYYQEQYQLFLFTSDYFTQTSYHIGGIASYLGSFLTQFFYYPKVGALIIAVLLVIIQELILFLSTMMKRQSYWTLLTFIPSIIYWHMLCDENTMMTGVAGLIIALLAASAYMLIENQWVRMVYLLLLSPILYVMIGGVFMIFIFLSIIIEYFYFENMKSVSAIIGTLGSIAIAVGLPYLCSYFVQAPLDKLYWGFDWYRFPVVHSSYYLTIWIPTVLIPMLFVVIPDMKKHAIICTFIQFTLVVVLIVLALYKGYNGPKEEIMHYDFLARSQQWEKIVQLAQKKSPNTPMSVADMNLALCMTGQMGDNMFNYYQHGPEGLMPDFERDFTLPLVTSEIYYYLGFINTAQRYAFEAMEAIPDYQKSGRVIRRLAETNLINGEYKVTFKYLKILQKTLFYKKFAMRTMALLWNEKAINADPEYGWLRKCRPQEDFLFSEGEKDQMLGTLFVHNRKNRMAYEYLMAYYLLSGNMQQFAKCFPLGDSIGYQHVPLTYQKVMQYLQTGGRSMQR